jgi:hypothetical protein
MATTAIAPMRSLLRVAGDVSINYRKKKRKDKRTIKKC